MIAAFLLVTSCAIGADDCQVFENERWDAPTAIELQDCADMADRLNILFLSPQYGAIAKTHGQKVARCEITPMEGDGGQIEPAGLRF